MSKKVDTKNTDKESSGGSNAFLEAKILEDSLSDEEIQLRAVTARQMKLNQHRATALKSAMLSQFSMLFSRLLLFTSPSEL